MCSSGRVPKSIPIHYLIYDNSYDKSRFVSAPPFERIFASDIAVSLGYDINFMGPYDWWCPPPYERDSIKQIRFTPPDIDIEALNYVSAGAMYFVRELLVGSSVEIFPEGASCYSNFRSLYRYPNCWVKQLRPRLARIKRRIRGDGFEIKKYWVLPDRFGKIRSAIADSYGADIFSERTLYDNYYQCALYFSQKYRALDFFNMQERIVFHPLLESVSESNYASWVAEQTYLDDRSIFFLKSKPRVCEARIPEIFKKHEFYTLPTDFHILPGELVIPQFKQLQYFGCYSSMILGIPPVDVNISFPPDDRIKELYERTYAGLSKVLFGRRNI